MKKLLAILLIGCTLLTLLPIASFATSEDETVYTTGCDDLYDPNAREVTETVEADGAAAELPAAFSLKGDIDIPVIGNQGAIGCCTAMSTTYMQFTNAISKLYHKYYPKYTWNPSTGARQYIFSPKYTYDFSASSQSYSYDSLMTMGVPTLSKIGYAEGDGHGYYWEGNQHSMSWANGDAMFAAMQYRLNDYESESVTYSTRASAVADLITRIKQSVIAGNVVTMTGSSGYWQFTKLSKSGDIGKAGESALYAAMYYSGMSSGGHAISIVGYDDNVECIVDGKTLKGAVLMANSWGDWNDAGYTWVMYDALCAYESAAGITTNPSAAMYLTMDEADGKSYMFPTFLTELNQDYKFTRVSSKIIAYRNYYEGGTLKADSAKYYVYTIQDTTTGNYLAYTTSGDAGIYLTPTKSNNCYWAFIPYSKIDATTGKETGLCAWDGFNVNDNYDSSFNGSYWVYAVNRDTDNLGGNRFLDAGLGYASSGRQVGMATLNSGSYPEAKSWFFEDDVDLTSSSFTTKLGIFKGHDKTFSRSYPFYSYYFTKWDENYEIGYDEAYLEVNVTVANRNAFFVKPIRRAKTGSTSWKEVENAQYTARYSHLDFDVNLPSYLTYSGVLNGAPETVTLYYSFADLGNVTDINSYDWGAVFGVSAGITATVNYAKLLSGATATYLADILDEPLTITSTTYNTNVGTVTWSDKYYADSLAQLTKYSVTADLPEGLKLSTLCSQSVTEGDSFTFDVLYTDGTSVPADELTKVYVNGNPINRTYGVYTIYGVDEDAEITVDYAPKTYYTVSVQVNPNFTFQTACGEVAEEGSTYSFKLIPVGSASLDDTTVTVNGNVINPSASGVFSFTVTENTTIVITYKAPFTPGDMNDDGIFSILDVSLILTALANGEDSPAADVNEDGIINIRDVSELLSLIAQS